MFNNENIKEIDQIIFGIYSPAEILRLAVCKIDKSKNEGYGSVYDPRLGACSETNLPCETCGQDAAKCPGHFGYIELNEYIIHPLFYKTVVSFLRCFCTSCSRLLITREQLIICDLARYKKEKRFKKLLEKLEKVDMCCHCRHFQPKITFLVNDNSINMSYKHKAVILPDKEIHKKKSGIPNKISIPLSVDDIKKIFDSISDDDVKLCGFDPSRIHPRNLILTHFPVLPPCARPFVKSEGNTCDDDLTNQLIEIIKSNNILGNTSQKPFDKIEMIEKRENKRQKAIQSLKFRILTFYNNSNGKAKHPTNGEL